MIYSNFCSTSVTIIHILSVLQFKQWDSVTSTVLTIPASLRWSDSPAESHCRLNGEHNPICVTQEGLNETKYKSEIDLTLCISLVLCAVGAKDVQD